MYNGQVKIISQKLKTALNRVESNLEKMPEGKLRITRNGNRYKWYYSHDGKFTYIPKKNRRFAEQLAQKEYLQLQKKLLQLEIAMADQYVEKCDDFLKNSHHGLPSFTNQKELENLLGMTSENPNDVIQKWVSESVITNTEHIENLKYKTAAGFKVRSKSEVIIANALTMHKIPFRYECRLELGGNYYFPDFTILNPKTYKVIYWEHFGMMDVPLYREGYHRKMAVFTSHGIVPTINLITTYETMEHPLDAEYVEQLISFYFE